MANDNSSPSTSTPLQEPLTPDERMYRAQLPDELLKQLQGDEMKIMCRLQPDQWPPELIQKAETYIDLED